MSGLSHEDVRSLVIQTIREKILKVIKEVLIDPHYEEGLKEELKLYEQLIREAKDIPLIIKNEKKEESGRPDIELFGGRIVIEVKVNISEFKEGEAQLESYVNVCPLALYAILTNSREWIFYKAKNGKLELLTKNIEYLIQILKEVITCGIRLPLSAENAKNMFSSIVAVEEELYHDVFQKFNVKDTPFFKAYKNIMNRLYEGISEEEERVERLFIKHTLMQMIVASCLTAALGKTTTPIRACSGEDIESEIVLPYLRWWTKFAKEKFVESLVESIYSRSLLLDWKSGNKEDIFRELYEILIDAETRRRLGEYYTPLWLVQYMMNELSKDQRLRDKIILDPFCGTGSFLVEAFYRKIYEGSNPDKAIKEVIGFDINPLSVSIARAELIIAYNKYKEGVVTPLIFNTDSVTLLLREEEEWQPLSLFEELIKLEESMEYIASQFIEASEIDFSEILKIESIMHNILEKSPIEIGKRLKMLKDGEWGGSLTKLIVETLSEEKNIKIISELVEKYGNGVWAIAITSLFVPYLVRKLKADIIATNPPWRLITEIKGSYGEFIRKKASKLVEKFPKSREILNGSDLASILLHGCKSMIKEYGEMAFLLPKEAVYTSGSYHGLGKILTYEVIKNLNVKIIEINIDAFRHGRYPCIAFLKKKGGAETETYQLDFTEETKRKYSKTLHLKDISYIEKKGEPYPEHIEIVKDYCEYSPDMIRGKLAVEDVISRGDYIMGLFGGSTKKEAKKYAGLVFEVLSHDITRGEYMIKLWNTDNHIKIPGYFLENYWNALIYVGAIFPFTLTKFHNILLSEKGKNDLKAFLRDILEKFYNGDKAKVNTLIEELEQPESPKFLTKDKFYVVYRCRRSPMCAILTPEDLEKTPLRIVVDSHCSYLILEERAKAYYYCTMLNYLVYKVVRLKGSFERDMFLRPLQAIIEAGLEWRGENWQKSIAKLGEELRQEIIKYLRSQIKEGMSVRSFFKKLMSQRECLKKFEEIKTILEQNVDEERLASALRRIAKLPQHRRDVPTS